MQKIESNNKIKDITKEKKYLNHFKKLNQNTQIYSDENKIFNEFFPENNIQVIRPIPIKTFKDNNFLGKKRAANKGLFQFNNYFKNQGENKNNYLIQFKQYYEKSNMERNPFFSPEFLNINGNIFNFNKINYKEKEKLKKPLQIKINVIINNYITTDGKNLIKKKPIFGISINKKKFNKKDISKISNPTDSIDINKSQNESKENSTHIIAPKKFEIFKTNNLDENDNLSYDEIKKLPKNKKRGRKALKESKRQHNALDQDNIIRKIQVHFLSFIIYFCNDLIQTFLPLNKDLCFKNIQYELKKTVNHAYIEKLKSKNIGDILQLKASPKNKKFNGNINKSTFDKICSLNPFLKKFFEMSYLDMFNNYYCQTQREIDVSGYKVKLSQRTRLFIDLITKNLSSAEKIKEIAEEYFINKKKNISPIFVINKNQIINSNNN
jgi:hypothetical protein